jgi:ornithine lipid hydroxylase
MMEIGFENDMPIPAFLISYAFLFLSLLKLERLLPFERRWLESDGQAWNDIGHTLINKGVAQALAILAGAVNLAAYIRPPTWKGNTIWPESWPMILQVLFALTVVEFILYWMHRWPHENPFLWRFHALHHSALKLWVVNTGRFHFLESCLKVIGLTVVMLALGMPMRVIYWVSVLTAHIGIFTHCNVEMKDRWISWIFNTPTLHRWHHSPRLDEGNMNYGETVMIWDIIFGTFYHPNRRPATDIGLNSGEMPKSFRAQLKWPFTRAARYSPN